MNQKICKVEGCNKPYKAHGYCNTHNEQIRIHGKLLEPKILNKNKICEVENCNEPVLNKNYCRKHYQEYWKYGKIKNHSIPLYFNKEWLNQKYNIELIEAKEIAKMCNVTQSTILQSLYKYQISLKFTEPELCSRALHIVKTKFNILNMKEYLINEYIINNKSAVQIGKELQIDRRKVTEWMELFDIPRRGNTESIQLKNSANISPTEKQWQLLLGSWMGDGSIRKRCKNSNFRLTHGIKQYDYLKYKQKILEENGLMWFSEQKRKGGGLSDTIRFAIEGQCTSLLNDFHKDCYPEGKAIFNQNYLYQINDYGLYIWYLDDGSLLPNNSIVICTDNFSYNDNVIIQQYFKEKYNINTKIFKVKGLTEIHYRIRINQSEVNKFLSIIDKYKNEVECMIYKFNTERIVVNE
jgi:hypothetical protein